MSSLQAQRLEILEHTLKFIPKDGWSLDALRKGAKAAGYAEDYGEFLFAEGIYGLITLFVDQVDFYMVDNANKKLKKVSEKVRDAVLLRIQFANSHKKAMKRLISFFALPWNLPFASKLSWQTADLIWTEIVADKSTDFNYYTKRATLACIYNNTLLYSIKDSEKFEDTAQFLEIQMDALNGFYKIKSKFF